MPQPPPGIIDSIDQIAPLGSFVSPAAGNVSGIVSLAINASDPNDQIASVTYLLDGVNIGVTSTAPYSGSYDTRNQLNGPHTFSAVIRDRVGNQLIITQNVTFANGPVVTITTPGNGATATGMITFQASITSYDASVSTQFQVDGSNIGGALGGAGTQQVGVESRSFLNGPHTWSVVSTDGHGNSTTASITVTHNNVPVVSITSPANGATFAGGATFSVNVTTYDAATSTQFRIDGTNFGAALGGSGALSLGVVDTRGWGNGPHTIYATTSDGHGNSTQTSISVTVANVPVVAITSPGNGAVLTGAFNFTGTVTYYDSSVSNQWQVDGVNYGAAQGGAAPAINGQDSRQWLNGAHTITLISTDVHGNATSTSVSVTMKNAPVITITSPGNGANVAGVFAFNATITTYDASCSTQFQIDGTNVGGAQAGSGGLGVSPDSRSLLNGAHTLSVISTDGHGNQTTASISVTYKNVPVVSITSPTNGQSFGGTFNFRATVTSYDASCSTQFRIDGGNYGSAQSGAGNLGFNGIDSHTLSAAAHTFTVISTDGHGNATTVSISATVTNSIPGGGKINAGNYREFWPDDGAYEDGRWDVQHFNDRFNPNYIWSGTGSKTGTLSLPGNPDPTHYQMYCIQNVDWCEAGTGGTVVILALMLNGGRYEGWQNGGGGDCGQVFSIGGGDTFYYERYDNSQGYGNASFTQGCGVRYWFGLKAGYNS